MFLKQLYTSKKKLMVSRVKRTSVQEYFMQIRKTIKYLILYFFNSVTEMTLEVIQQFKK